MALLVLFAACTSNQSTSEEVVEEVSEVNVYTHRHYEADKKLFADFETATGIKVKKISMKAVSRFVRDAFEL